MKKEAERAIEEITRSHVQQLEQLQFEQQQHLETLTKGYRQEIEQSKTESNQVHVKIAELNVMVKNDQTEIKRLLKENHKKSEAYEKLIESAKED